MAQASSTVPASSPREDIRSQLQPVVGILRRLPFTVSVGALIVVLGLASYAFWRPFDTSPWWPNVAYGLPALEAGRWWTPVTGAFFATLPAQYVTVLGGFAAMVGLCEWRLGTRMAALLTVVGQLVGVLGTCAFLAVFSRTGWEWANTIGDQLDTGITAGSFCALMVVAHTLRAPWRGRIVVAAAGYCIVSIIWVGLFWDVAHIIAVAVGIGIGWYRSGDPFVRDGHLSRHEARIIAVALLVLIALAQTLAMVFPGNGPLGPEEAIVGRPLILLFIVAELVVAAGIHRGNRLAWSAAMALSITGLATALTLRPVARGVAAALVFLPLLVLLVRSRRAYTATLIPATRGRVIRDIAIIAAAFAGYVFLGFLLIDQFRPQPDVSQILREVVDRVFFQTSGAFEPTSRPAEVFLASISLIPTLVVFSVLLILLLRSRTPAASLNRDQALQLLHKYGGGNLSWMATWPQNAHFLTEDRQAAIAYQVKSNTAVALGDPVGEPESREHAVREFARFCERQGWVPCFFSSTAAVLPQAQELLWRHVQVAEDTVIDLPTLAFKGKSWQDVRTALNRAAKAGVTFRIVRLRDESFAMVQQARDISDEWVSDKGLPEMGFTLGGVDEALDPEVRVGLAVDADGVLQGITSWLPVYGLDGVAHGWTLDVMRRRPDGFRPVMEFMIASACLTFKEQGAYTVSLSGAPLARSEEDSLGGVGRLLDQLGEMLEPVYGFRSLHQFKTKFKPRYEPMYMVFTDEAALPRVGLALTQAFLPDARLRDVPALLASTRG